MEHIINRKDIILAAQDLTKNCLLLSELSND